MCLDGDQLDNTDRMVMCSRRQARRFSPIQRPGSPHSGHRSNVCRLLHKISQTETEEYSILPSIHSIGSYPINNSWSFFFCSETSALGFVRFFVSVNNSDFIVMFYTLDITCLLWDARMRCPGLIAVSYRSLCYSAFWCFALTPSLNHFRKTSLHFAEY